MASGGEPTSLTRAVAKVREKVSVLREFGADLQAQVAETILGYVEAAIAAEANELLSIDEAARRAQRSRDTIERAIRDNRIPNAGKRGKPKVRAGDLRIFPPRIVAPEEGATYDVGADVRDLLVRREGG